MKNYLSLMRKIRRYGDYKDDRTGTGTRSIFGTQLRFDLLRGFPLLTTKKVSFHNIKAELLWFLQGNPNINFLHEHNCHIWDEWVKPNGTFGPIYGAQWRTWPGNGTADIDQLGQVIDTLQANPDDRRMIVSAWNPAYIKDMALPPCHAFFQFYSRPGRRGARLLSCQMYQRSCDYFLGVPYNIASYALLTHMVAQVTGHIAEELIWVGGDTHLYRNHFDQVKEQLTRLPRLLPQLALNPAITDIDAFTMDDIHIHNYTPHGPIHAPIAV